MVVQATPKEDPMHTLTTPADHMKFAVDATTRDGHTHYVITPAPSNGRHVTKADMTRYTDAFTVGDEITDTITGTPQTRKVVVTDVRVHRGVHAGWTDWVEVITTTAPYKSN